MSKIEGEAGTWSHCGVLAPHSPHHHTIVMNEGPYHNILCHGYKEREEVVIDYRAVEVAKDAFDEAMEIHEERYPAMYEKVAPSQYRDIAVLPVIKAYLQSVRDRGA